MPTLSSSASLTCACLACRIPVNAVIGLTALVLAFAYPRVGLTALAIFVSLALLPPGSLPQSWKRVIHRLVERMLQVMAVYWKYKLVFEDEAALREKGQRLLFGYEPHSVLPWGMNLTMNPLWEGGIRPVAGAVNMAASSAVLGESPWVTRERITCGGPLQWQPRPCRPSHAAQPIVKHFWWESGLRDISRPSVRRLLESPGGGRVAICPGGVQECVYMRGGSHETFFLRKRFGFIKLAIQTGAKVVPVVGFGQGYLMKFVRPGPPLVPGWLVKSVARVLGFLPMVFYGEGGPHMMAVAPGPTRNLQPWRPCMQAGGSCRCLSPGRPRGCASWLGRQLIWEARRTLHRRRWRPGWPASSTPFRSCLKSTRGHAAIRRRRSRYCDGGSGPRRLGRSSS